MAIATALLCAAVSMTLNALKFGDPLQTGYGLIYEGRATELAKRFEDAVEP